MKQIFKTEMKRAMRGNGMALSILIGILIGTAHVIQEIIPADRANITNFQFCRHIVLWKHGWLEVRRIWKGLYSS